MHVRLISRKGAIISNHSFRTCRQNVRLPPSSDYSDAVCLRFLSGELWLTAERKEKLWEDFTKDPPPRAPPLQLAEGRGQSRRALVTSQSAHVDVVRAFPLKCSYNVATGGQLVTAEYNKVKRCCYIICAHCNTTGWPLQWLNIIMSSPQGKKQTMLSVSHCYINIASWTSVSDYTDCFWNPQYVWLHPQNTN